MKIRLFESFQDSPEFQQEIGNKENRAYISIYHEPADVRGLGSAVGKCKWTMDLVSNKSGYESGEPKLTYLYFVADYEDEETDEIITKEYEIQANDFNYEKMKSELEGFPLYLRDIEIDMNHTHDPEFWEIELRIGTKD